MTPALDIPDRHPCAEAPWTPAPRPVVLDRATMAALLARLDRDGAATLLCGSDLLTVRRADAWPK